MCTNMWQICANNVQHIFNKRAQHVNIMCEGARGRARAQKSARAWVRAGSLRRFWGLGPAPGPFAHYFHICCFTFLHIVCICFAHYLHMSVKCLCTLFAHHFHIIFILFSYYVVYDFHIMFIFWIYFAKPTFPYTMIFTSYGELADRRATG